MEPTPPIFVVADDNCRFPLLFVAGTLGDLDNYLQEHAEQAESTPVPGGGIRVTSRFYDLTGRRWYHEGGGGSEGGLVDTEEEVVSQQYLRDIVARGYADLVRFEFEEQGLEQGLELMAVDRAFELQSEDFVVQAFERRNAELAKQGLPQIVPNQGNSRHRRWHRARGISINRSH